MTVSAHNRTTRWTCYTAGGIFILLGAFSILHPFWAFASTAVRMGVGFLLSGLNNLVPYASMKDVAERPKWLLPMAVIDITFGLLFLSHIGLAVFALSTLLGVWVILGGFVRGCTAVQLRAAGVRKWWVMLTSAALAGVAGAFLLSNPFTVPAWVDALVGATLIGAGLLSIMEGRTLYPPKAQANTPPPPPPAR